MRLEFGLLDIAVFIAFVAAVITTGLLKSRREQTGEDYFLAGRGLKWWLIGFSLIAANISSEQFVGMSGNAASHVGLAIASYEWMAAITLVVVAFGFLPYFLRAGIYTMPEFLEVRYNAAARTIMAVATLFIYMLLLASVTYSGALTISTMASKMGAEGYTVPIWTASLVIGLIAMVYVTAGGLKACAWADLIQGSALIVGGGVIMYFAFRTLGNATGALAFVENVQTGAVGYKTFTPETGAVDRFMELNRVRMNMFLPSNDKVLPWTALLLGLWIPNFYYWGLNQYITQRTLGSESLAQGQKGIMFAAFMKLLIPFVIVVPGIMAFNLFAGDMQNQAVTDNAVVIARYLKANPDTQLVEVAQAPNREAIAAWPAGRFLLAVYPEGESLRAALAENPFVLPLTQTDFAAVTVEPYTVFESDDKTWDEVFPKLAAELQVYNQKAAEAAAAAKATLHTEKFIAYKYDTALGQLLSSVLPQRTGLVGFVLAALLGAVVSSLAAMLNAASTIFTMDIYKKYISPNAGQKTVVFLGRASVLVFTAVAVLLAPQLGNPKISNSIFTIIQESQGLISPGILAVFAFGLIVRKAPPIAGVAGLLTNIVTYGGMYLAGRYKIGPDIQFLNRMAICFALCLVVMWIITMARPLPQPIEFKKQSNLNLASSRGALVAGILIVLITLAFYVIFSPIGLAK
ncbi:MAG: sodium/solute symporter [Planctomycetes bacterium]|jgi:SSS family solute:Na+ symporter|nr:sodium/solute symporter [Planctomycetota bacterium]